MDGLERLDTPQRWPWVVGAGVVVAVVAGLIWFNRRETANEGASSGAPAPAVPAVSQNSAIEGAIAVVTSPVLETVKEATPSVPAVSLDSNSVQAPLGAPTNPVVAGGEPRAATSPDVTALVAEADALLASGKKDKAREQYLAALAAQPAEAARSAIETKLGALNVELIRLPWPMDEKQEIVVQAGDSIKALARKYGTTVELIIKGNQLKRPDIIIPGQRLKIFAGKMEIHVNKTRNDLLLTANGRFFKRYHVGTGRYDKTPVGSFVIYERVPEPPWWREDGKIIPFGDKENILGTRWMAIKATGNTSGIKGYGIHGTWDTNSIGKAESAGCIRLLNADVEELFELVPVGTPVTIEE